MPPGREAPRGHGPPDGHRIRLEVSSSNFPRYDRNSNTGGVIAEESASEVTVAVNRVLHGPAHPSRLILPVIRR